MEPSMRRERLETDELKSWLARQIRSKTDGVTDPIVATLIEMVALDYTAPMITDLLTENLDNLFDAIGRTDGKFTDAMAHFRKVLDKPTSTADERKEAATCIALISAMLTSPLKNDHIQRIFRNLMVEMRLRKKDVPKPEMHKTTVVFASAEVAEAWRRTLVRMTEIRVPPKTDMPDGIGALLGMLMSQGVIPIGMASFGAGSASKKQRRKCDDDDDDE
jgi:hypothetical protein